MLLLLAMLAGMMLACCAPAAEETPEEPAPTPAATPEPTPEPTPEAVEEYTEPIPEGHNQLTLYWTYPGTYENCDIWIWFPGKDGKGYTFHECEYGGKVIVNVPEDVEEVGFIVRRDCSEPGGSSWGSATKDFD